MSRLFVLLQRILPQHFLSRLIGKLANARATWLRVPLIKLFVAVFGVDLDEAAFPTAGDYGSFNDFFTRELKASARTIAGSVSSPVDGAISMCGALSGSRLLQAKGLDYSLEKLLAGSDPAPFVDGSFLTAYLSPKDYHRVHIPVTGDLVEARYVPGRLFSVNDATTRLVPDLFAINERLVMRFDTALGPMTLVMVGAMIVAGIRTVWRTAVYPPGQPSHETFDPPQQFEQGAAIGHFELGSTVVLLMGQRVEWSVEPGASIRMGQSLVVT